ncbi:CehA/McbA family metallohydrolase [Phycisphaerales bacterium AB-hyl4]|uniref:CehA/McbA family metallohydrolase n=1 Tax=Natronomicrosphaera hydrolytica TaxID=3242702 RepID=A0ABV4U3R2_9BACT
MSEYHSPYTPSDHWLRGNVHAHTTCGRFMDISESGRMYARLGYDFLAVTDHNKTCTPAQAGGWQQAAGLVVVPGEENGGTDHMIELGVHDVTPTPGDDYTQRAAALRDAGGFVIACHPQEYPHGDDNVRKAADVLHAIEIYNGLRELRGTDETRNVALWDELLTQGKRLFAVATDDFHCQYTSPGHGWVNVQTPADHAGEVTWETIVEQLKQGAFYASTGPGFDKIHLSNGQLHVKVDARTKHIRVIGPGSETLTQTDDGELTWSTPKGLPFFRVEAHRGIKRAWSQPFFAEK